MLQRLTALEADLCRVGSSDPVTYASTILDAYTQHPHPKQKSACHRQVLYNFISVYSFYMSKTIYLLFIIVTLQFFKLQPCIGVSFQTYMIYISVDLQWKFVSPVSYLH